MSKRDNFSAKTVRSLQSRVACRCSNPGCRRPTSGPAFEEDRSVNTGVAAHITAAAEGGPRYDRSLTPEDRKAGENGIWLCQICAKLIDSDVHRFSTDLLRRWKRQAIEQAFKEIATSPSDINSPRPRFDADQADFDFLRDLGLSQSDTADVVFARALASAINDIATFRGTREWPAYAIALNLITRDTSGDIPVDLEVLAKAIGVTEGLSLVSPPGTGKSTTLVQLAERIAALGQFLPVLVPLGEWSDRTDDFFDFIIRRNAFGAFRRQHFMQLAYHGRLVLILDGWNELDPSSRTRAIRDLRALRRDYPELGVVIGTRRQAVPIAGKVVEIELMSANQQLEIARAQRGAEGEALVDRAWRTAGVQELVAIPLYLNTLLAISAGSFFPKTKEEVLRMFVEAHERVPETAEILRKELHGFHSEMLAGLAVSANRAANTSIHESNARQTITTVAQKLSAAGQLTGLPQPTNAIDILVGSHVLMRSATAGGVMFQHQQFQEWYASYEVERLMVAAAEGDTTALTTLREEILDRPAWEESVLFACERLSRAGNEEAASVANAVAETIHIDPMFAAEMIYRSTIDVWQHIADRVIALVDRWHRPGKADRAARFMIATGQPAFADRIWSLILNEDSQVYLRAIRAADRFRPSVLGSDAKVKLASLREETRKDIIGEIASQSGYDGIELATELAKIDPNPEAVVDVIQSLAFRRADRHVIEILKAAPQSVWSGLALKNYPDHLDDPALEQRLLELREHATDLRDPLQQLAALAFKPAAQGVTKDKISELVSSPDFPTRYHDASHVLHRIYEKFPDEVAAGLLARIKVGMEVPYECQEYLGGIAPFEDGAIVAVATSTVAPARTRIAALSMVGPNVIGSLIDQIFELHQKYAEVDWKINDVERRGYYDIKDAIVVTRFGSFLEALIARSSTEDPARIALLADLILRHGKSPNAERLSLSDNAKSTLAAVAHNWIDILLSSPQATRHQMSEVAWALQRFGGPEFAYKLKKMLDRDLSDWTRAREARRQAPFGPLTADVTHSYTLIYQNAFLAVGGEAVPPLMKSYLSDLQFGVAAASVLAIRWRNAYSSSTERSVGGWPSFNEAAQNRAARQKSLASLPTTEAAETIFAVVRELLTTARSDDECRHAIGLAQIGLSIPHASKRRDIDALLRLPIPYSSKQGLLTAAAKAGEILNSGTLLIGLQELLEAAKTETWRLDSDRNELVGWLVLFAFSETPRALVEAIKLVGYRHPSNLRRVLETISSSPHPDILSVLDQLAKHDNRLTQHHEWFNAILKLGTEAAAFFLLDHIDNGRVSIRRLGESRHMIEYLALLAQKDSTFQRKLILRYISAKLSRDLIEAALAEVPDEDTILSIIQVRARIGHTFHQTNLHTALRNMAVGRRPAEDWPGAFQEFSISLAKLRRKLFQRTLANNQETSLAKACLDYIETLRDEHGRINDEPRHPDIQAGGHWP